MALLHLSDEHARLFEGENAVRTMPRWMIVAAVALIALLLVGWLLKNNRSQPVYPATFDLTVHLDGPAGEQAVINEGQVSVRLGETVLQAVLNRDGEATFRDVSEIHRGDSVFLQYTPPETLKRRFKITQQRAALLTGKNQTIGFTLEFLQETTIFKGTLRDPRGPVAGARITVDGNLYTTSDASGYFEIAIPKPSGADAHFLVEKNGQRKYAQTIPISSGFHSIPIE